MGLSNKIKAGLSQLSLSMTDAQIDKSLNFLELLCRWNKVTNLTAVTTVEEMVSVHLMDSLSIASFITGTAILDVGSGAGLPGIPLALFHEDKEFTLLDSNGKKTRFMTQAKIDLGLTNVEVVKARVEEFSGSFDHIVCRAFRQLDEFVDVASRLLAPGGTLLAMKGPIEKGDLDQGDVHCELHELSVPGVSAQRYLIELRLPQ